MIPLLGVPVTLAVARASRAAGSRSLTSASRSGPGRVASGCSPSPASWWRSSWPRPRSSRTSSCASERGSQRRRSRSSPCPRTRPGASASSWAGVWPTPAAGGGSARWRCSVARPPRSPCISPPAGRCGGSRWSGRSSVPPPSPRSASTGRSCSPRPRGPHERDHLAGRRGRQQPRAPGGGALADEFGEFGPALALMAVGPALVALLIVLAYPETAHKELEELNPEDAPVR